MSKRQPHAYPVKRFDVDEYMRTGLRDPKLWVQAVAGAAILAVCFILLFVQPPA